MHTALSPPPARLLIATLALLAFGVLSLPLHAEDVIVTSTLDASGTTNSCPPSCCDNLGTTTTSSTYSTATPAGVAPRRTRFAVSSLATWTVTPSLVCTGRMYKVYVSKGTTSSCPTDLVVNFTAVSGCSLYDISGVAQTSINTLAMARGTVAAGPYQINTWIPVCIISNTVTNPTIKIAFTSCGSALASDNRWYMDEVRFEGLCCPCCGFVPPPNITGPLAAGQTSVNVTALLAYAINVTVYANRTNVIGWTNFTPSFTGGTVTVPTRLLIKGDTITATQTITNAAGEYCTSSLLSSAPIVGSGSPKLILSLGCQKNTGLTGPIGTPTPSSGNDTRYWVKATGTAGGLFGAAPVGGWEVIPSHCWQTLAFNFQSDPCLAWLDNTAYTETNAFAILESLAVGMDGNDPDSGPYLIYVDKIMNGDVVLADFECDAAGVGYPDGTTNVNFANPNAPPIPPPVYFLSNPLSTRISGQEAFSGTNSCRFEWQFVDNASTRWCRLLMNNAPLVFPQVDTTKPVTLSVLVRPANPNPASPVTITNITATNITYVGGSGSQFVLMSTNALSGNLMPHEGWQRAATNYITPGSFPITPTSSAAFYYIKSE